jgi:hypothetical protein
MKYSLYFIVILFSIGSFSQAPEVSWMKRYGGTSSNLFSSLLPTNDGGFLLGGLSNSGISGIKTEERIGWTPDYWIIKTDSNGTIEWQRTIGGGMPTPFGDLEAEVLRTVKQASGGGYFLGGNSDSPIFGSKTVPNYGFQDFWIVKTDNLGTIIWQNNIGGSNYDEVFALEPTAGGGCIVGGYSSSGISGNKTESNRGLKDYWVVKLTNLGTIEWQKTYGGNSTDILYSILVLEDGNYILSGTSASNISGEKTENSKGGGDFWILKIDSMGNIIWQKTIGGNSSDQPYTAIKLNDGFVFAGVSYSNISFDKTENSRGGADYWIVKTDFQGNILWDKTYGGGLDDNVTGLTTFADETGFVLAGSSYSGISGDKTVPSFGEINGWVLRLDENGQLLWQKGIGGSNQDGFNQVVTLPDKTIMLGGYSFSPISGNLTAPGYGIDYWLVKLEPEVLATTDFSNSTFSVYPNPTSSQLFLNFREPQEKLEVLVYNSLAQLVDTMQFQNQSLIDFSLKGANGLYFLKIVNQKGEVFQHKVIKK